MAFDSHGVLGAAVDHTFRLAEAPPLKSALATSTGVCALICSTWFFDEVIYHHPDAHPELYRPIETEVKTTPLSAYIRVPGEILVGQVSARPAPGGPQPQVFGNVAPRL